eukprot:SAG31_NODE_12151_length_964_cov_0.864740_1_plen_76_part_00
MYEYCILRSFDVVTVGVVPPASSVRTSRVLLVHGEFPLLAIVVPNNTSSPSPRIKLLDSCPLLRAYLIAAATTGR